MEKHYIPKEEELCIGLECEIRWNRLRPDWDKLLIKSIHDLNDLFDIHFNIDEQLRVKYLDKQDIESLGFDYIGRGFSETTLIFRNEKGNEIWLFKDHLVSIFKYRLSHSIVFTGTIKNKSELKKLMIQLGIA